MRKSKLYAKSPIICEPRDNMNMALYVVGWISRALVHFACVFGSSLFIADSFAITSPIYEGMPQASVLVLALSCLAVSLCTSLAAFNKKTLLIVPPLSLGAFFLTLLAWGNPVTLVSDGLRCVWNTALNRMAQSGYYSFSNYATSNAYSYDPSLCLNVGMAIVAIVFGVIFGLCLIRKGKLLPTAVVCVLLLVPVFTYNLTRTNAGMTAAIVFIVSALSMSLYDRRYSGREFAFIERRERRRKKKEAKAAKKAAKRAEKLTLKKRAEAAYKTALSASGDKKIASAAKRAVYSLDAEEKKNAQKAIKEEKAKAKREAKRAKKTQRKDKKKLKKENALRAKNNRKLAKKDKDLKNRLNAEKKTAKKEKSEAKKARITEKRRRVHEKNERKRYNIAAGGFAGLCAVICALGAVWLPAAVVSGNFPEIPVINEPMSTARAYVSAYLSGDDVDLNDLNMYGNLSELAPRTLSFDPLEFEGTQIFAVNTDGQYPVYLKSWMGRTFDEETGTWLGADADQVVEYRSLFSKNFTPDSLKTQIYSYLYPTSSFLPSNNDYLVFEKGGFAVGHVNVRRINSASKIVFIPYSMNTDYSVLDYNALRPIESKYSYFYDGIYSSRFFDRDVPYSTVSYISTLKHPQVGESINSAQEYFALALDYINAVEESREILRYMDDEGAGYSDVTTAMGSFKVSAEDFTAVNEAFEKAVKEKGLDLFSDSLVEQYLNMDDEAKEKFFEFVETEEAYSQFAAEAYSTTFGGESIAELASTLLAQAGYSAEYNRLGVFQRYVDENSNTVSDHDVIMTVINYLRENYTYTITPTAPEEITESVLHSFLFDTKEGYCTHFATAAAALVREMGYPVRFCEGYIATEFKPDYSKESPSDYVAYVHDDDAHAWIEVYLDTLGWSQYEATPEYASVMYDSDYQFPTEDPEIEDVPIEEDPTPDEPEEEPEPEEEDPLQGLVPGDQQNEPKINYARIALIVGIILAIIAAIFGILRLIWYFLRRRAKVETDKRLAVVHEALAEERRLKTPDANRALCLELNDIITLCLTVAGLEPEDGEGNVEFSQRLDEFYGGLSEYTSRQVIDTMLKAEFGKEMTAEDLHVLGDFASRFIPSVYGGLSPLKKLYWRYIKRLI